MFVDLALLREKGYAGGDSKLVSQCHPFPDLPLSHTYFKIPYLFKTLVSVTMNIYVFAALALALPSPPVL
jgi:hypothetical protein